MRQAEVGFYYQRGLIRHTQPGTSSPRSILVRQAALCPNHSEVSAAAIRKMITLCWQEAGRPCNGCLLVPDHWQAADRQVDRVI